MSTSHRLSSSESRAHGVSVLRASAGQHADAALLLDEYSEAIGLVHRDSPEVLQGYLAGGASALWIAYVEGVPAACVLLRPLPEIAGAVECKRLFVRPQFRGRGIADSLLDAMEAYAHAAAFAWVYLDSKDSFTEALRIYARRGYQICERYNQNPEATVFLRKGMQGTASPLA